MLLLQATAGLGTEGEKGLRSLATLFSQFEVSAAIVKAGVAGRYNMFVCDVCDADRIGQRMEGPQY